MKTEMNKDNNNNNNRGLYICTAANAAFCGIAAFLAVKASLRKNDWENNLFGELGILTRDNNIRLARDKITQGKIDWLELNLQKISAIMHESHETNLPKILIELGKIKDKMIAYEAEKKSSDNHEDLLVLNKKIKEMEVLIENLERQIDEYPNLLRAQREAAAPPP